MPYKTFIGEKADITNRLVTGFCSVFGNVDSTNDIVWNGAFSKTIAENRKRFRHLWQHNTFEPPIAYIKDIREVNRNELPNTIKDAYPEATGGLLVAREYLDTPRGNEVLQGIKAGAINEMSFMYDIVKSDMQRLDDIVVYNLRELRFYESSDVNWGANEATIASKSFLQMALQAGKQYLALKTEDTKEGRVLSSQTVARLKTAISTLEDILLSVEPIVDSTGDTFQTLDTAAQSTENSLKEQAKQTLIVQIKLAQMQIMSETI